MVAVRLAMIVMFRRKPGMLMVCQRLGGLVKERVGGRVGCSGGSPTPAWPIWWCGALEGQLTSDAESLSGFWRGGFVTADAGTRGLRCCSSNTTVDVS